MIIGLTGGIATGKTTVSHFLQKLGAKIIDADKIAHEVLKKGNKGWKQILKAFGKDILNDDGEINRSLLGRLVFSDTEKRRKLEKIVHPIIIKEIEEQLKKLRMNTGNATEGNKVIVLDAPLLYETGLDRLVDQVWVVYTDKETQLERLQKRDGLTLQEARDRISAQMDLSKKCQLADRVIYNTEDEIKLQERILTLWREINED